MLLLWVFDFHLLWLGYFFIFSTPPLLLYLCLKIDPMCSWCGLLLLTTCALLCAVRVCNLVMCNMHRAVFICKSSQKPLKCVCRVAAVYLAGRHLWCCECSFYPPCCLVHPDVQLLGDTVHHTSFSLPSSWRPLCGHYCIRISWGSVLGLYKCGWDFEDRCYSNCSWATIVGAAHCCENSGYSTL